MRVLVTGGAGFIGSHVVDALTHEKHDILVLDDLSSGKKSNVPASVEFVHADIRSETARSTILRFSPQCVFHLAAQMDVRRSVEDPYFDADVNVLGTLNIARACAKAGAERLVFASSGGAIYGEQAIFPAPETHPTQPTSPYGVSKLCGEKYLEYFSRSTPMKTAAMRFANVYGPRQDPHGEAGVVAIFCGKLLADQGLTIYGDGEQTRDYVFVGDVVQACMRCLTNDEPSLVVNVGTGKETSVNHLASMLALAANRPLAATYAPARAGEQSRSVIDPSCAAATLGWTPAVSLETGLRQTLEWFRHNPPST